MDLKEILQKKLKEKREQELNERRQPYLDENLPLLRRALIFNAVSIVHEKPEDCFDANAEAFCVDVPVSSIVDQKGPYAEDVVQSLIADIKDKGPVYEQMVHEAKMMSRCEVKMHAYLNKDNEHVITAYFSLPDPETDMSFEEVFEAPPEPEIEDKPKKSLLKFSFGKPKEVSEPEIVGMDL